MILTGPYLMPCWWLWSVGPSDRIGSTGLEILANGEEEIYFSAASSWEIAIKAGLGRFQPPEAPTCYVPKTLSEQGIHPLSVTHSHSLKVYDLSFYHSDPFDRLLVAQALAEEMVILTSDRVFKKYPVQLVWCGE
jgi:PIN domain nuclease of toxin-antitoxin system